MILSWPAIALLAFGTIMTLFLLALFATDKRYLRPPRPDRGVEFVQHRVAAEETLSNLAPEILEAESLEKAVIGSLREGRPLEDESRRAALRLLREADVPGLWRSFGTASSLVEDDPRMARAELDALVSRARLAWDRLAEAERACNGDTGRVDRGR